MLARIYLFLSLSLSHHLFARMKKLSASQCDSVSNRRGLFTLAAWNRCVAYLYAQLTDQDPVSTGSYVESMLLVKMFVDWALQVAKKRFSALGHECLLLASTKEMCPELQHPLSIAPCVFSARTSPQLYCSPAHLAPVFVNERVQRKFSWWAYHEQTGLETPHFSDSFVYESQYSHLVVGMYVLGHLSALLKRQARKMQDLGEAAFKADPVWPEMLAKIGDILFTVHAQLVLQ